MIILFLVFLVQFSLACACLAVNDEQRHQLAKTGWEYASNETRITVQATSQCCGFDDQSPLKHPSCASVSVKTESIHRERVYSQILNSKV